MDCNGGGVIEEQTMPVFSADQILSMNEAQFDLLNLNEVNACQ